MINKLFIVSALLLSYQSTAAASTAAADVKTEADAKATESPASTAQAVIDWTIAGQNLMERLHNQIYQSYHSIHPTIDSATEQAMPRELRSIISSYFDIPTTILMSIPTSLLNEMIKFTKNAEDSVPAMLRSNFQKFNDFRMTIIKGPPPFPFAEPPPFPFAETERQRLIDADTPWAPNFVFYHRLQCNTCHDEQMLIYIDLFLNGRMRDSISAIEPRDLHDYSRHDEAFRKQHAHKTTANNPFGKDMPPQDSAEFKRYLLRHVNYAARVEFSSADLQKKNIALLWYYFHRSYAQLNAGWWRFAEYCMHKDMPYTVCF